MKMVCSEWRELWNVLLRTRASPQQWQWVKRLSSSTRGSLNVIYLIIVLGNTLIDEAHTIEWERGEGREESEPLIKIHDRHYLDTFFIHNSHCQFSSLIAINDMMDLLKLHLTLKWRLFMLIYEFMFSFMSAFNLSARTLFSLLVSPHVLRPQCLLLLSRSRELSWKMKALQRFSCLLLISISARLVDFNLIFNFEFDTVQPANVIL